MIIVDYDNCCWKNGSCNNCSCNSCDSCTGCVEACPLEAITRKKVVKIDENKCIECGLCINACLNNALSKK